VGSGDILDGFRVFLFLLTTSKTELFRKIDGACFSTAARFFCPGFIGHHLSFFGMRLLTFLEGGAIPGTIEPRSLLTRHPSLRILMSYVVLFLLRGEK
jgi:hypothetical protein